MVGIYKITNPKGKVYIGQATNWEQRKIFYNNLLCKGQPKIYNSLKKYGPENHVFDIIEECDLEQLDQKEEYYKQQFINEFGWKLALFCQIKDGKGGLKSEETKLKMRKPKPNGFGKNVSKLNKGKPQPKGFGEKISKILKEGNHSQYYTKEVRDKMRKKPSGFGEKQSKALKGKNNTHRSKPVLQFDLKNNFIKEYPSIAEAARILKVKTSGIVQCCTGKIKTAYGFIWKHKN